MPLREFTIESPSLADTRRVSVYIPPNSWGCDDLPVVFCADGQSLVGFTQRLEQEIQSGRTPKSLLIGVHSRLNVRNREYVPGLDKTYFEAHEHFFTDEVFRWTQAEFGIGINRANCGVFGYSLGGVFALTVGLRHRTKYGAVIAFSLAGVSRCLDGLDSFEAPLPKCYLACGMRERPVRKATRAIAATLQKRDVETVCVDRPAAHDFSLWESELPEALRWSFLAVMDA